MCRFSKAGRKTRFGAGDLADAGEVAGKPLELTLLHHPPGVAATRVLLAGAGKPEKFDRRRAAQAGRRGGAASEVEIGEDHRPGARSGPCATANTPRAAVEGAILGEFEPDRYKTDDDKKSVESFAVVAAGGAAELDARRRPRAHSGRSAELHARAW